MASLAWDYHQYDRLDDALKLQEQVFQANKTLGGESSSDALFAGERLAQWIFEDENRKQEAIEMQEYQLSIVKECFDEGSVEVIEATELLASFCFETNLNREKAIQLQEMAVAAYQTLHNEQGDTTQDSISRHDNYSVNIGGCNVKPTLVGEKDDKSKEGQSLPHDIIENMKILAWYYYESDIKLEEALSLQQTVVQSYQTDYGINDLRTLKQMEWLETYFERVAELNMAKAAKATPHQKIKIWARKALLRKHVSSS